MDSDRDTINDERVALSRSQMVWRGVWGMTVLSVAGFAPWALWGRWISRRVGEVGLYAICAMVFIGLSGPLLHRLIHGRGSIGRFYRLFAVAFAAYAAAWIAGWMALRGDAGSLVGLLGGALAMSACLAWRFGAWRAFPAIWLAIFLLNTVGYFAGGWIEGAIARSGRSASEPARARALATGGKLLWGVCYGAGLGAGLGLALWIAQFGRRTRSTNSAPVLG